MKAVQIVNPSEMKVVELEKPTVGAGEVSVGVKYVGFCGSDLNTFLGRSLMVKLPATPRRGVGTVTEETSPNVLTGFEKEINVILNPYVNCGKCASYRNNRVDACEYNEALGVQRNGAMCEYAILPWTKVIPAGNIFPRDCTLIEPMSVGFHAVSRVQAIDNEYVMVIGCSMIGIGAIIRAALGGTMVIAVDLDDEKLELAKRVGASYVISSKTENVYERIQQVMEGFGADIVTKAVGSPVTYVMAVDEAGFTGRVVCIGYAKSEVALQVKCFVQKELNIHGSRSALPADFRAVINYMRRGNYPVKEPISKIARPEGALEVIQEWIANPGKVSHILAEF